jgi:hypothetical protein
MSHHQEYTIPMDVISDEAGVPEEGISPEENVAIWQQEIQELGQLLPRDSGAWHAVDGLARNAEHWSQDAERVANGAAEDLPTEIPKRYDQYHQAALLANATHTQQVTIGSAHSALSHEYPTAGMVDTTLSHQVPRTLFDNVFGSYRAAIVGRAHQETVDNVTRRYKGGVNTYFDDMQPAIDAAAQADPDQTSRRIFEQLVTDTDKKLSPILDELRHTVMSRKDISIGSIAMADRLRADSAVTDAVMRARQALFVPSRFTNELTTLVTEVLQKSHGLPSEQQIADRIAGAVDRARNVMTTRLHKQIQHIAIQYQNGVPWQNMNVAPLEYQVPQQSSEKPQYAQEVDDEIAKMRAEGLPDNVIHRRLARQYHPEATAHGNVPDDNKARYVSAWYAGEKAERLKLQSN